MKDKNIEETDILKSMDVVSDFQKRANNFDEKSQWVTDKIINSIPFEFLVTIHGSIIKNKRKQKEQ